MVHGCQTVIKRVGFVHRKIHAGQQGEVEAPVIPDARGALAEMPDVAAEPNDLARFELSDDGGFEFVHRQVEVNDGATFRDVTQQTDGVGLVIGLVGGGSVDDADNLFEQVADVTLGKGQRSEVLLDVINLILIDVFKAERLGRLAVAAAQEAIHAVQNLVLFRLNRAVVRAGGDHVAELLRGSLERTVQNSVHLAGVAALIGFVVNVLGNDAVFADDVGKHIPLTAIVNAGRKDVHHGAVAGRQSGGFENALKEIVAPLELVPECQIALGKLKVFQIARRGNALAQYVRRRKQPAAAAGFLIGDFQRRYFNGELLTHGVCTAGDKSDVIQFALGESKRRQLTFRALLVIVVKSIQMRKGNRFHTVFLPFLKSMCGKYADSARRKMRECPCESEFDAVQRGYAISVTV